MFGTFIRSCTLNDDMANSDIPIAVATIAVRTYFFCSSDALRLAEEQNLDLVEVAPKARPPVCRIMDYGKFRYEQQKREKEANKKQRVITIKEVKLRPNIEQHDFDVKLKNAQKFVDEGNKVKVTIMFRGREMSHQELGKAVLDRVADRMKDSATIERSAKLEGKNMYMVIAPKSAGKNSKPKAPVKKEQTDENEEE